MKWRHLCNFWVCSLSNYIFSQTYTSTVDFKSDKHHVQALAQFKNPVPLAIHYHTHFFWHGIPQWPTRKGKFHLLIVAVDVMLNYPFTPKKQSNYVTLLYAPMFLFTGKSKSVLTQTVCIVQYVEFLKEFALVSYAAYQTVLPYWALIWYLSTFLKDTDELSLRWYK